MLTLYWYWSFNPQKARLALEELELEYSLVTVDLSRGGQHADLIGELNPNKKVPVLTWRVNVTGRRADGSPAGEYLFVDARSGKVTAAEALLRRNAQPTEEEIREALGGNLCRCTGYTKIIEAVKAAAA